ncbi:MAG: hypothetical protein HY054_08355 [Proteobacteria bacterium]|nr:hypothetical protein [Pseudomonadota bacterium]
MTEQDYWFARTRPGSPRGLTPVHGSGWLVIAAFVGCMLGGAALFGYFMFQDRVLPGVVLYALLVLIGAGQFIYFTLTKTDPTRTVADYRAMKRDADLHDQLGGRR